MGDNPKRRKSMDNPYTIDNKNNDYNVSFKDIKNKTRVVKITKEVYEAFDSFELDDLSQMNKYDRHIEHSEVYNEHLYLRSVNKTQSIEEQVEDKLLNEELQKAIKSLSDVQKRRILKYYFDNKNEYYKPKDDKGRWFIGTTKTESGTRKIHLSQTLKIALQNYKKKQDYYKKIFGRRYIKYRLEDVVNSFGKVVEHRIVREELSNKNFERIDLIFTKENGLYLGTDITRTPFKIIHNELGIKKCRFYDLRGSYATKILNSGVEIRDVADLLGHKNIETTENFYISSTEDSRKYATEVFDNISKSETINRIIEYKIDSQ